VLGNEINVDVLDCSRVCDGVMSKQNGNSPSDEIVLYPEGVSHGDACIEVDVGGRDRERDVFCLCD
jgi:hypothetical protein